MLHFLVHDVSSVLYAKTRLFSFAIDHEINFINSSCITDMIPIYQSTVLPARVLFEFSFNEQDQILILSLYQY